MLARVRTHLNAKRGALLFLALVVLAAGGYAVAHVDHDGRASADSADASAVVPTFAGLDSQASNIGPNASNASNIGPNACATTVLDALGDIAWRVYREGIFSERTAAATAYVERSRALRLAVERDDPAAASAAARKLIGTGHMTSLRVTLGAGSTLGDQASGSSGMPGARANAANDPSERVLVNAGTPSALAPLHGLIKSASGVPIARFVTSVWADEGLVDETNGITQGQTVLRESGRDVAAAQSFALPAGPSGEPGAPRGTVTVKGVTYDYISFAATAYPDGRPLRIYVLRTPSSLASLCASTSTGTLANTLERVAQLIYTSEAGPHALVAVHRAQHNQALLRAVAAREPEAARLAIDKLLNQHIVRMRVSSGGDGGTLLSDVGGPYVLAPVSAPLRLNGRQIGTMVLSIQDDEGYKRLAERLAGLDVLMYTESASGHPQLVKNSLGPGPPPSSVPASGPYSYNGHAYQVFTIHARAFPFGSLRIVALIPIPYS